MAETEIIRIDDARILIAAALTASGASVENAHSAAAALVAAEAEGQVGHGFSRVGDYAAQLRSGKVDGAAVPALSETRPAAALIDAGYGFAYPAMDRAIDWGITVALREGCAQMGITRSHHCGALSVQVEKIARAGCVGMMVANAPAAIAPWGSDTPVFGTNPIAFAAPRNGADPLVIDLSLSRVARGKIMHARKSGQPIPEGWALDAQGEPTTDPEAALAGSMVPIGEAKGTALALMVEILASVMTGANLSTQMSSYFSPEGPPPGSGQFFLVLRPQDAQFAARLESLLSLIEGLDGARLPGRRRAEALARSRMQGMTVSRAYLQEARRLAGTDG